MPRIKSNRPPIDGIEKDFLDAISRLVAGEPTNPTLRKMAKSKRIKVNKLNVALEAGHSRTLISLKDCKYPNVGTRIDEVNDRTAAVPRTHTELIEQLRHSRTEKGALIEQYKAESIAHFIARAKAEKALAVERGTVARLRRESMEARKIHLIKGSSPDPSGSDE